jgi:hypothetical protein
MDSRVAGTGVEDLQRAIDEFERYCLGLLDELELSKNLLTKIDAVVKVLLNELNEDTYMRVLQIWQEVFRVLSETVFDDLSMAQLLKKASKHEIKEVSESEWLKRIDIVESVTGYVLIDAEKRFRENVIDTVNDVLITKFSLGKIIDEFDGSWAISLDNELITKRNLCSFILCENALLTNILYSPSITSRVEFEWWIAPKNSRPISFYIPFGIVDKVIDQGDLSYRDGLGKTIFDLKLLLKVEDALEENRLPYVMNRLRILRHMAVFNELDVNIEIRRNDDETDAEHNERKSRIIHHIMQHGNTSLSGKYALVNIVEGEPKPLLATTLASIFDSIIRI